MSHGRRESGAWDHGFRGGINSGSQSENIRAASTRLGVWRLANGRSVGQRATEAMTERRSAYNWVLNVVAGRVSGGS
jgi:hypothetical protein